MPDTAKAKARKNIEEGRGVTLGNVLNRKGNTNYEFSTSNPMWRASLEILDFLPISTVDYSGGMIISDWYSENNVSNDSIKITIRFLSNEIRTDSLKILVHKKTCDNNMTCRTSLLQNSIIQKELHTSIIRKAALIDRVSKKNKKK